MIELQQKAKELNICLSDLQIEQFQIYYEMLIEKNKVMNLTAITEYEEVINKHFLDSILLGAVMDLNKDYSVIDVGTGAGFPGIPLKIVYPQLQVTLLDSLNKRVTFLNEVIDALKLEGIKGIHARAEEVGRKPEYREAFNICVSRAVANLSTLSEYCLPLVKQSGYFISYKSAEIQEELQQSQKAVNILGGKIRNVEALSIPDTEILRQFVVIEKTKHTPKAYPRKAGIASKNPLS